MLPEGFKLKDEAIFEREIPKMILEAIESDNPDELLKVLCEDLKNVAEWVCVGESFTRTSDIFRKMTEFQIKFTRDPEYISQFKALIDLGEKHKSHWIEVEFPDLYKIYDGTV